MSQAAADEAPAPIAGPQFFLGLPFTVFSQKDGPARNFEQGRLFSFQGLRVGQGRNYGFSRMGDRVHVFSPIIFV